MSVELILEAVQIGLVSFHALIQDLDRLCGLLVEFGVLGKFILAGLNAWLELINVVLRSVDENVILVLHLIDSGNLPLELLILHFHLLDLKHQVVVRLLRFLIIFVVNFVRVELLLQVIQSGLDDVLVRINLCVDIFDFRIDHSCDSVELVRDQVNFLQLRLQLLEDYLRQRALNLLEGLEFAFEFAVGFDHFLLEIPELDLEIFI